MPLLPVTVIVYVPVPALLATFIVRVDFPEVEIVFGVRLAVNAGGAVADSVTVPVKPLRGVTVIVEVPEYPLLMVKDVGDADSVKSGLVTWTVKVIVCIKVPLVPVTVTEYSPLPVLLGTVTLSVD